MSNFEQKIIKLADKIAERSRSKQTLKELKLIKLYAASLGATTRKETNNVCYYSFL